MSVVDELARLASHAEPPPLDDAAEHRLIERALLAPRRERARTRASLWVPIAAIGVAVAAIAIVALRPPRAAEPALVHVALPTGDRLVGTEQARFAVERVERADRRVRLERGTVLADVAHVVPGQRFAIATAHLVATAKGTIFSVETDAVRTRVRVFEGIVEVTQDGGSQLVGAGTMWSSDEHVLALAPARPAALAPDIAEAIERREATPVAVAPPAKITVQSIPEPEPAPAPVIAAPEPPAPDATREPKLSPPDAPAGPSLDDLLARARAELAAGKLDAALATAKLAAARGADAGAWRIITADALRGLGHASDAADAYEQASRELAGADAVEAGYSAAYLRFKEVKDYERALDALVIARVDAADSPLEERGLALHAQILVAAKRAADARPIAERYLARYPHGELRALMRSLTE